jgi:colanic acid/amylovoran biosynthesis glycosyltransferase
LARLAIFTAQLGTISETFIRRHLEGIAPGETVAVARHSTHPTDGRWQAPCPVLFLDRAVSGWPARIAHRGGRTWPDLRASAVARFLRRHGVRVVLGEYLDQFVEFVPLLDRMSLPYVVQGHGIDLSAALRDRTTAEGYLAYRSARAVLTRCEPHRRRLIDLGLSPDQVKVNQGGVEIPTRVPERGPTAARRLLAIGRMTPKKGPIYLLEAFRRAALRDPGLTLDYVGAGELLAAARQFVAACDLEGRVRLHGAASAPTTAGLLADCGVFVQHSLTDPETGDEEGLPTSIQEAMAHGLAVVATRHAGIPETVIEGETGLLVDEGDVGAMAEALAAATAVATRLGAAGRRRAEALYGWDQERARLAAWLFAGAAPA